MVLRAGSLLVAILAGAALAADAQSLQSLQPPGWDANLKLAEAGDANPDPKIVEINLEAAVTPLEIVPGVRTDAWTYNGGLPGPLIRARRGDRLIVHFSNRLPASTTVHWHGVQVPIEMDGVPGISQPPVAPGGTFTYDFVVPDAGLFWYHPHVLSAAQVGFGLYGPLLVEDPDDPVKVADELVLVLSDISTDDHGVLEPADNGGVLGALLGREGNHVLVNGRVRPTVTVRQGALQRWRIVNTAKSRYFELALGDTQPFELIGVDGGHLEYSLQRWTIVLGPGERADVLVAPRIDDAAVGLTLVTHPFDRGFGSTEYRTPEDLIHFERADLPPAPEMPLPKVTRDIPAMTAEGATPINIELVMTKTKGDSAFAIQGGPFWRKSSVRAEVGEKQLWTITNTAIWAHPIHLHGFFFQEVDDQGVPLSPRAWKDTIHVPVKSTRRFLVKLDRPGSWMYHCHILDHAEAGLMSTVDVGPVKPVSDGEHTH
jgi:FtsP/CotA-like multicopper oxidase with cupredoxin domain